jgi:hypothetical protein
MNSCCGNGAFIFNLGMKFNDNLCHYLATLFKSHGVFFPPYVWSFGSLCLGFFFKNSINFLSINSNKSKSLNWGMFEITFEVKCRGRTWTKNIVISSWYESLLIGFQFWSPLYAMFEKFWRGGGGHALCHGVVEVMEVNE